MKNIPTLLAAGLVVVIMVFYMCTFTVRFTEVAILETFGQASEHPLTEPSLYFKLPWPIQNVVKFDKRVRILEDRTEETITADSKNVIVATSTLWSIENPYLFHKRFAKEEDGEQALRNAMRSQKKAVVGQYDFSNFVSTDPGERKLRQIEQEMLEPVREVWQRDYGVALKYFGITRLTLPQSVTEAIFESMKKYEQNKADNYRAEGEAQAAQIVAAAQAAQERILAVARRKADEIRNEGDRVVSTLYAQFKEHPQLRMFLDQLNAIRETLLGDTTLILDNRIPPFSLFREAPIAELGELNVEEAASTIGEQTRSERRPQ